MRTANRIIVCLLAIAASGCVARAVVGVATAPIRGAAKAVDLVTTSQAEADRNRGRDLRRREERLGQLERSYRRESERCAAGNAAACDRRDAAQAEIDVLLPTIPAEPD